jgi:mannose-6-phosphate isomerase-like protein (cupin superfamily)
MLVKPLKECLAFVAGDHTLLRETLHPDRDTAEIHYSLAHAELPANVWSSLHRLTHSEVYYILSGRGTMEIDGEHRDVEPGDTIYIPPSAQQRIFSHGPDALEFLCIVDPAWRAEDEEILG